MKKFILCAAALLAAISFSACSDSDDDGQKFDAAKLLGRWVGVAKYEYATESESYVEVNINHKDHEIQDPILDFKDEKTVLLPEFETDEHPQTYTYTFDGIKIKFFGQYGYKRTYTIMSLTNTQMELWKKDIDDDYKVLYERKDIE